MKRTPKPVVTSNAERGLRQMKADAFVCGDISRAEPGTGLDMTTAMRGRDVIRKAAKP